MENDIPSSTIEQEINIHKKNVLFDIDDLRKKQADYKLQYNNKIKEFRSLENKILENERKRCEFQKKTCDLKHQQKLFINSVNSELVLQFQEIIDRIPKEVSEIIFNIFLGFKVTPIKVVKKMLSDEKEFKSMIKEAEINNSFHNTNNKQNSLALITKIANLKKDNTVNLEFPVNKIIEFVTNSQEIYIYQSKIDVLMKEEETMEIQKNDLFINLKKIESEIIINDGVLRNLTKQNLILTEKMNRTKLIQDIKERNINLNEISSDIWSFKRKSISSNNFNRKTELLNNLTLKSNYSDENESNSEKKLSKNQIKKAPMTPEHNKPFIPEKIMHKKNETIDNIIESLSRMKTEGNKMTLGFNSKKNEKTIKLKSIKTNEKYLNNNQDTSQLASKASFKNQSLTHTSNILSPANGSLNTSVVKKDNKVKIKIENVSKKQTKKSNNSSKSNKKNILKSDKAADNSTIKNNYQQFEKLLNDSTKDLSNKKLKTKHSNSINQDLFSNNGDNSGVGLTTGKQNLPPLQTNSDVIDNINEEWIMSPMNKINVKSSKLLSEKTKNEIQPLK